MMEKRISVTILPLQQDMLQPVWPRRSKMFLKWQEFKIREPPPGLKPKPEEQLHIWQKVERIKELNVLEDYYWFYEEWDRINKLIMKRFYKTFPELLMERIHHHRIKMENAMLLARCILALAEEDTYGDNDYWEKSLRKYPWFPTPGVPKKPVWNDGSKTIAPTIDSMADLVPDRIGRADRDNANFKYFKDQWAHLKKDKDEWGAWEKFCFKIAANLDRFEPHYPDFVNPPKFSGLLILGKRIKPPLPALPPPPCPPNTTKPDNKKITKFPGPAAMISLTYQFFVNQVGEQSTKAVVLENFGETVLFYRWERRLVETLVTASKLHLGPHITDCRVFSLINGSGSIHSHGKQTFHFHFKSNVPGVFLENWVLRILPRLPKSWTLDPIFLKGVAFSEDHFTLQDKLSRILYHRERMSSINEFFNNTLSRAAKASQATQEVRCAGEYMFSSAAFNFLQKNLAMEPPVYYVPSLYQQLEAFATVVNAWELPPPIESEPAPATEKAPAKGKAPPSKVPLTILEEPIKEEPPWAWDGSFSSIVDGIEGSTMSQRIKQHFQSELVTLKELVQIPPHQTMILHNVVYKLLHGVTDHTKEVMEGMPVEFGRSMAELLMNDYYKKHEQERLEKEAEAAARMEEDPQAAEADKMESLLEQINTANPPLNEMSLESRIGNQDMLEYCFKWLHILTEMRMFMRVGFHDYEEQVQKEQQHLINELIKEQICKLIPFLDDETPAWDRFALERAKQGLLEGEKKLLKVNEKSLLLKANAN